MDLILFKLAFIFFISAFVLCDESPWIPQQYEVCFGGKDNNFGKLRLDQDGALYALKLVYRSGSIRCIGPPTANSRWGCNASAYIKEIGVVVTDATNETIFPKAMSYHGGFYKLPGYNLNSEFLAFTDFTTPMYVSKGREIRIWYREDLIDLWEDDNIGTVCVDVYAKFT